MFCLPWKPSSIHSTPSIPRLDNQPIPSIRCVYNIPLYPLFIVGAAVAKSLIERGARVVISDINAQGGALLQRELGPKCYFIKSDMSQASDREKLVEEAQKWAKETATASGEGENGENDTAVTILINNAGIQHVDPVERFPLSKWSFIMELMLTAPFHLSQLVLPSLYTAGYGRIINIGSIHSLVASVGKAAYVSAKHGLLGLTKVIRSNDRERASDVCLFAVAILTT